jgi:hypothetical protein
MYRAGGLLEIKTLSSTDNSVVNVQVKSFLKGIKQVKNAINNQFRNYSS